MNISFLRSCCLETWEEKEGLDWAQEGEDGIRTSIYYSRKNHTGGGETMIRGQMGWSPCCRAWHFFQAGTVSLHPSLWLLRPALANSSWCHTPNGPRNCLRHRPSKNAKQDVPSVVTQGMILLPRRSNNWWGHPNPYPPVDGSNSPCCLLTGSIRAAYTVTALRPEHSAESFHLGQHRRLLFSLNLQGNILGLPQAGGCHLTMTSS